MILKVWLSAKRKVG